MFLTLHVLACQSLLPAHCLEAQVLHVHTSCLQVRATMLKAMDGCEANQKSMPRHCVSQTQSSSKGAKAGKQCCMVVQSQSQIAAKCLQDLDDLAARHSHNASTQLP